MMPEQPSIAGGRMLSWLHIGDLHITDSGEPSHVDLQRIVALANELPPDSLDFVLLPGDNADDGTPEQFALVRDAIAPLRLPVHVLPGDHDFKPRNLDAFHAALGARPWPFAITDFRLGDDQLTWAEHGLEDARAAGQPAVVFMHTYPADLRDGSDRNRVGAWPGKGILGTQLGPNRNGRKW